MEIQIKSRGGGLKMEGNEGIKKLHQEELYMFEHFKHVCSQLGLTYYAANGTLIGALRHKGFIPWDDDIDVSLSRDEYELFVREGQKFLPNDLKILTYQDSTDDTVYTARIVKQNTRVIVKTANVAHEDSLWMDIWALDGMPGNSLKNKAHKLSLLYKRMLVQLPKYDELIHQHRTNRPWYEKLIMKAVETFHFGKSIDIKKAKRNVENCLKQYDINKEKLAVNFWTPYKFKEEVPSAWYGKGKDVPFEDSVIHIPDNADGILRQIYGDYMTPPPDEDRGKEHCIEIITV